MSAEIYGDRVRAARILRGIRSGDLAKTLDWPASRQTRIEQTETTKIDDQTIHKLASALKFPLEYFLRPPTAEVSFNDLLFRAPASTPKREKLYLSEFARAVGELLEWIDGYHRLPPVKLPTLSSRTSVQEAALQTRKAIGISEDQPIGNLTHRIERVGVPIIIRRIPPKDGLVAPDSATTVERHIGYSTRVGSLRDRPLTILRAQDSWERTRWTIAHETGHHVLHSGLMPRDAEEQASRFASELLAPAKHLSEQVPRHVTLAALAEIKLHWGISIGTLIRHLYDQSLISQERKETLQRQLYTRINPATGRTWGRDEPGHDSREPERPSLLVTWIERCLGGTAPNLVASLSEIWPPDIIAMILGGRNFESERAGRTSSKSLRIVASRGAEKKDVVDLAAWRVKEA